MTFSFLPFSADAFSSIESALVDLQLIYDSNVLLDSARVYGTIATAIANNSSDDPILFFGPEDALEFNENIEYTLSLNTSCRKESLFVGRMEVYLVGPAFPTSNPLGVLIAEYTSDDTTLYSRFDTQSWNFTALNSGLAHLRFVLYSGQWHVSSISIQPAQEFGFTPDSADIVVPIDGRKLEHLGFKVELYDVNNNLFPITVQSNSSLFDGGTIVLRGMQNRIDGEIIVAPSGSGATITSAGYYDKTGIFQSGSTAIYIGDGQHANANTPFFAASSSNGPVFSVGDRIIAEPSGSEYVVTVSGTLLVERNGVFQDVRYLITSNSDALAAYSVETATAALVSSSAYLNYSSSVLQSNITSISSSAALGITTASILDSFNKIIRRDVSNTIKPSDGLYIETSSLGYFNKAQSDWPVLITSGGTFRIADSSSYTGNPSDPYSRMVGMANGAFVVRSQLLYMSASGFLLTATSSAANNILMLGSATSFASGTGFYADGAGNFRVGGDTAGNDYVQYTSGGAFLIRSKDFYLSSSNAGQTLEVNTSYIALGSPAPSSFNPSTAVQGFYVNRAGQLFIGSGSNVNPTVPENQLGNFISFGTQILNIRSSVFRFSGGNVLLDSGNSGSLALGTATSLTSGTGFYANGSGQFRVGTATSAATSSYIQFSNNQLVVKGQLAVNDPSSQLQVSGGFTDIRQVVANYIAYGPFGFYISNL